MVTFDTTTLTVVLSVLVALAAITAVTSVTALTGFLASNRKVRLARHESIRSYYGRTHALTH